jgi:arginine dihydrolase
MDARDDARILMCRPDHFGVSYTINPWMDPASWASAAPALASSARSQWRALTRTLKSLGARIELVPPVPGLPDLVFTANAAVVMDRVALLARFRHPERQGEEIHFERTFRNLEALCVIDEVRMLPDPLRLEGAGDCVWDRTRQMFWMGFGPRSDRDARAVVQDCFGIETVALELVDPRFYHMDTALCPLSGGEVLYVPQAFDHTGRAVIAERIASDARIAIEPEDAERLAANAVCLGRDIVLSHASDALRARLAERGYRVHAVGLDAFGRSGGSAFCLTLRLDNHSGASAIGATEKAAPALVFG